MWRRLVLIQGLKMIILLEWQGRKEESLVEPCKQKCICAYVHEGICVHAFGVRVRRVYQSKEVKWQSMETELYPPGKEEPDSDTSLKICCRRKILTTLHKWDWTRERLEPGNSLRGSSKSLSDVPRPRWHVNYGDEMTGDLDNITGQGAAGPGRRQHLEAVRQK